MQPSLWVPRASPGALVSGRQTRHPGPGASPGPRVVHSRELTCFCHTATFVFYPERTSKGGIHKMQGFSAVGATYWVFRF